MNTTDNNEAIPGVSEVMPGLFISGTRSLFALPELRNAGIRHVLKLYPDEPEWPEDFTVFHHPLEDGVFMPAETLRGGTDFIRATMQQGNSVLVVCGLGISRSATFILAYLLEEGYDLREALRRLRAVRPQAWPARALWESLIAYSNAPYRIEEVYRWIKDDSDRVSPDA